MKTLARPALRSAATSISTMAGVRIRALTERHPIKPTSPRCHSAWQLNLGRYSTYRRGKSVQTTGTTSFHETTEHHLATETLEDLFQNAIMALHLVSGDGTILRANVKELQMLGYSPDEDIGRNIAEFHVDQITVVDMLERLSRNEHLVQYPARMRRKDGSIRHVLVSSNARFRDGEFVNTRCFTVDITERLRAEERVRWQEEQRTAATYQYAPIGIAEVDAEAKVLRANAQSCVLLGYSSDEALGHSIFEETVDQSSQ